MNIVFMGTPDFAVDSLCALAKAGHNIAAVFTQPDRPTGRGYKLMPPPVKQTALELEIPVFQPNTLKDQAQAIINLKPDVIAVVAYGKLLPKSILEIPPLGCVNLHGSLLPKYRGAAPIQWNIINGDKTGGVTTMLMDEGLDSGDILLSQETAIRENETAGELFDRLKVMGARLLAQTLTKLEAGSLTPVKQDEGAATYAPKITKDMCVLDFNKDAYSVHKLICGLSPYPAAYIMLKEKKLKILRSQVITGLNGSPGETIINDNKLVITCGKDAVELLKVQYEGSKPMSVCDFLNGWKNKI